MGDDHLTVNIVLKDYVMQDDMGSWGLARAIILEYQLDTPLQLELIGEMNNIYVNKLQARIVQENGGIDYYTEGATVKIPNSKWQTLLIVGLILPKETGTNPPSTEPEAVPEVIYINRSINENLHDYILTEKVEYFIVHDTAGNISKETVMDFSPANYSYDNCWRGHTYIFSDGTDVGIVPYNRNARATKTEWSDYNRAIAWGAMLHFELIYENGPPSEPQYQRLAYLYDKFYRANRRKLIIVPHREIDRGIPDGHSDPRLFSFDHFYGILKDVYGIEIEAGVDGITQERYEYPNQVDMIYNFPPILSGRPERE